MSPLLKRGLPILFLWMVAIYAFSQNVTGLTLMNADTDVAIRSLAPQDTIDLAEIGANINVRADVSGTVGSVRFAVNSASNYRTESTAPYAMAGDVSGDYWIWSPDLGMNTITATSYTEANAGGTAGTPFVVNLLIENSQRSSGGGTVYELPAETGTGAVTVSGQLKKWHKVTLSIDGPAYKESDLQPSPFLDYRMKVTFTNGAKSYVVPGYFAADGNAAETSADSGNVWRVHFAPDEIGEWNYFVSMRLGGHAAVSDSLEPGIAVAPVDGVTGTLTITDSDKTGRDNRAKGRLQYVGAHYLKYAETGELFVKGGADAPENFLAYEDFDNTPNSGGFRKSWSPHAADYNPGDPSWQGGKGTEIIGAINYLASEQLNVFSFLTMNINGDDKNVYPYVSTSNFRQFDCSKLDQWEMVFEHADSLGMYLHFKTQETENEMLLDNGDTDVERRLYYRELIARFSHHLALNWNLGEENGHYGSTNQSTPQRKAMAAYFAATDPYQHHIVIHTAPNRQQEIYPPLLGAASELTGVSIQTGWSNVHNETQTWVSASANSGKRWVVTNDEQGAASTGVPDDAYTGSPSLADIRKQVLWGNLMAGGGGVEYYFGYDRPHSDLNCQDYRSRDLSWDYVRFALQFFKNKPLEFMTPNDALVSTGWCLAQSGSAYIVYLPNGGTANLTLPDAGTYKVLWYNPRTGGALQDGDVSSITGSGTVSIGNPPSDPGLDWAVWITKDLGGNIAPVAQFTVDSLVGTAPLNVTLNARSSYDSDGSITSYDWDFGDTYLGIGDSVVHTFSEAGYYQVLLTVTDNQGAVSNAVQYIQVEAGSSSSECGSAMEIMSEDFDYNSTSFYLDTYTGMNLLAIQPTPPNPASATVSTTFTGESCYYDLIFHAIGENDGRAEFEVSVGGQSLGAYQVPLSTDNWEMGEAYNMIWEGIAINNGDQITVRGTTASLDTEWSRARWLKIELVPSECAGSGFVEQDGILVIEAEALGEYPSGWEVRSSLSGATGGEYLEYVGGNNMSSPNLTNNIVYPITITTPGTYQFHWHSRNGEGAQATDQLNDSWLMIECDDFYGMRNGVRTDIGHHYAKVWIHSLHNWSWNSFGEHGTNVLLLYATFNEPGEYAINLAGRSQGHVIDRMALYLPDQQSTAQNLTTPAAEFGCGGGNPGDPAAKSYLAEKVIDPIQIDGVAEALWNDASEAVGEYESGGATLPDTDDLSFSYQVLYDLQHIYLFAQVSDDQLNAYPGSGSIGDYDNISLFFNPDNRHMDNGAYGTDAIQLTWGYGVDDNTLEVNGAWQAGDYSEVDFTSVVTDNGYTIEAKIPWDGILPNDISLEEGMTMGFEVQVNDNDGGATIVNSLSWSNGTGNNQAATDTRLFGTVLLNPGLPTCPGSPGCASGKHLNVERFLTPPVIDADPSEWDGYDLHAGEYLTRGAQPDSDEDFSYQFSVGWDDDNFYILLDAKDESLNPLVGEDVQGWFWDNMEVFFNPDNRHEENGAFGADGIQMRMNYGRTDNLYSGNGEWKGGPDHEGFEFASADTDDGYIIEGQVPWDGAFPADVLAVSGHTFGFDVAVGDNDNGVDRETLITWGNDTGQDRNSRDTRVYGFATLVETSPNDPDDPTNPDDPTDPDDPTNLEYESDELSELKVYLLDNQMLKIENVQVNQNIAVYSSSGQLMQLRKAIDTHEEIDMSSYPSGVYIVKILGFTKLVPK